MLILKINCTCIVSERKKEENFHLSICKVIDRGVSSVQEDCNNNAVLLHPQLWERLSNTNNREKIIFFSSK
jgi:hypothetical protein